MFSLGGATSLDSLLRAHKTNETKLFFLSERLDCREKLIYKKRRPYDSFFSILRSKNPLGKVYNDFEHLAKITFSKKQAIAKLGVN